MDQGGTAGMRRIQFLKRVELSRSCAAGVRRLNDGLYTVLVEVRTGRRAAYYRAGTISDGAFMAQEPGDAARPAAESEEFRKAVEELLEFAAADSVMSE